MHIPYQQQQLDNGLTVIYHEDHSQPLVVVNINVNVGSRDEVAGRTGFAHLFEHLMFMGTKRVPEKMFDEWMEQQGGWNNAWTSQDRTDYYDVAPAHALPLLLWMEADRLSALGAEMDLDKLNTQRGVVHNERRQQTENRPYEKARLRLPELLYPKGHPYHHPVIGSHEDLAAASVQDVRDFFDQRYTPENVSLVVAGDFDRATTEPLIKRYFGALTPSGKVPERRQPIPASLTGVVRDSLEDTVSAAKLVMAWHSPAGYAPGDAELDLVGEILGSGKGSRLYQRLLYHQQLAQSVAAYQSSKTLQSHFSIEVIAAPGVDLAIIEKVVDEEIAKLSNQPMSERELTRAKNQYEASFIGRLQSLSTRASLLNGYFAQHHNPGYVAQDLQRYLAVTAAGAMAATRRWLTPDKRVILHILPRQQAPTSHAAPHCRSEETPR